MDAVLVEFDGPSRTLEVRFVNHAPKTLDLESKQVRYQHTDDVLIGNITTVNRLDRNIYLLTIDRHLVPLTRAMKISIK